MSLATSLMRARKLLEPGVALPPFLQFFDGHDVEGRPVDARDEAIATFTVAGALKYVAGDLVELLELHLAVERVAVPMHVEAREFFAKLGPEAADPAWWASQPELGRTGLTWIVRNPIDFEAWLAGASPAGVLRVFSIAILRSKQKGERT